MARQPKVGAAAAAAAATGAPAAVAGAQQMIGSHTIDPFVCPQKASKHCLWCQLQL
jgi:hypothetical protein